MTHDEELLGQQKGALLVDNDVIMGRDAKAAIAAHATLLFTAMPGKLSDIPQNASGNRDLANRAIDLAELFHRVLEERGYDGGSRHE